VDRAAENRDTTALQDAFSGPLVIGEEATSKGSAVQEHLRDARLAFTVDPIDGTLKLRERAPGLRHRGSGRNAKGDHGQRHPQPHQRRRGHRGAGSGRLDPRARRSRHGPAPADPRPVPRMTGVAIWRYFSEPLRSRIAARLPP
jgi:hypothetical protein